MAKKKKKTLERRKRRDYITDRELGGVRERSAIEASNKMSSPNIKSVRVSEFLEGTARDPNSPKGKDQRKMRMAATERLAGASGAFQTKKGGNIHNANYEGLNRKKKKSTGKYD